MSAFPIPLSPPFAPWRGLISEEDEALRIALSGFSVMTNAGKSLKVAYIWDTPQREMDPQNRTATQGDDLSVAEITYPNITVAFLRMRRDSQREQRGFQIYTQYERNSGNLLPGGGTNVYELPIPVNMVYQISVNAKNVQHTRQLMGWLSMTVLLQRFGILMCPCGTVRRLDVMSGPDETRQVNKDQMRIFRAVWIIEVSSEIEYGSIAGTPALSFLLSVENTSNGFTEEVNGSFLP